MLHYPPDPDSHGYQAAPTSAAKNGVEPGDDGASSSTSLSAETSSASSFDSDTDEVLGDDDSDRDIPKNYDNAKDDMAGTPPFRRASGASSYTGSLTSQASSSFNTKRNGILHKRHGQSKKETNRASNQKRKNRLHRLTRSETNPMNPFHRKAMAEAKIIEELDRARQSAAQAPVLGLDDDEDWMEGDFTYRQNRHNSRGQGGRRRSMSDLKMNDLDVHETSKAAAHRRNSQNSERPKKLRYGTEKLTGSALQDDNAAAAAKARKGVPKQVTSPVATDPVVPPDINAWNSGVSSGYGALPATIQSNLASTASAGSSGGGGSGAGHARGSKVGENSGGIGDSHSSIQGSNANARSSGLSWETVLGFDANFLSELLVPSRYLCNTRFELTVDDMAFLGAPVHVLPDGKWKRRKRPDPKVRSMPSTLQGQGNTSQLESSLATLTIGGNTVGHGSSSLSRAYVPDEADADDEFEGLGHMRTSSDENLVKGTDSRIEVPPFYEIPPEILNGDMKGRFPSNDDEASDDSDMDHAKEIDEDNTQHTQQQEYTDPKSDMRMFHVVFVMNPPVIEYNYRIAEMYHFILSKFARTLRYEQAKSNYVWNEVSKILHVRDKAMQEGMFLAFS